MIFLENCLPTDNSYEVSLPHFFRKLGKMSQNLPSDAAVTDALRVNYVMNEWSHNKLESDNHNYSRRQFFLLKIFPGFWEKISLGIEYESPRQAFKWNIKSYVVDKADTNVAARLTLNAPIVTKVVCFSRLLKCLRSLYGKQCGAVCSGFTLFASILNSSLMLGNYLQQTT